MHFLTLAALEISQIQEDKELDNQIAEALKELEIQKQIETKNFMLDLAIVRCQNLQSSFSRTVNDGVSELMYPYCAWLEDPEYLEELNNRWEICEMLPKIRRAAEGIYLPPVGKDGILPQFAGYGKLQEMDLSYYKSFGKNAAAEMRKEHTVLELESFRVHKQADLVLLLQLFPELPEEAGGTQRRQVREKNYEFYENTRSMKHPTALPPIP